MVKIPECAYVYIVYELNDALLFSKMINSADISKLSWAGPMEPTPRENTGYVGGLI